MQLSVPLYKAISVGRGATLDTVDVPLNNRDWLKIQFAAIRKLDGEEARQSEIDAIVNWTNPGPGGFYDDLGDPLGRPHLVMGIAYDKDPAFLHAPQTGFDWDPDWRRSWCRHAGALFDETLRMHYAGLDPEAAVQAASRLHRRHVSGQAAPGGRRVPRNSPVSAETPRHEAAGIRICPARRPSTGTLDLTWHAEKGPRRQRPRLPGLRGLADQTKMIDGHPDLLRCEAWRRLVYTLPGGPKMGTIRVVLADDHALVRRGVRAMLEEAGDIEVVGEAEDGEQALALVEGTRPDVLVTDIEMPGLSGLELTERIVRDIPATKVLILSIHKQKDYATKALTCGALGYLLKDASGSECKAAVRAVLRGESYLSPAISTHLVAEYNRLAQAEEPDVLPLTTRQREVLQLIAEGLPTKAIARRLSIAAKTVDAHRCELMKRLDIHDVAHLVRYAIRNGLIEAED